MDVYSACELCWVEANQVVLVLYRWCLIREQGRGERQHFDNL